MKGPFRICKIFEIESGHMLFKHPGKCKFPHGHSRKVECVIESDFLDKNDMVCDFKVLTECMAEFLDRFDHSLCVNTDDPLHDELKSVFGDQIVSFEKTDPTTEVMAETICTHLKGCLKSYLKNAQILQPSLRVVKVRVWETSTSWAEYLSLWELKN